MNDIKENHFQCGWQDQTWLEVNHYDDHHGLNLNYFWRKILFKDTTNNSDMEEARIEAARTFLRLGGKVIISVLDSLAIPENDRNAPIDFRMDTKPIGTDRLGHNIFPKMKTGDSGDQYYDWKPMTEDDKEKYLAKARRELKEISQEQRQKKRNFRKKKR